MAGFVETGLIMRGRLAAPREIGHLQSLLEGHEGLATVRTKDPALGIVEFWTTAGMMPHLLDFLESLRGSIDVALDPPRPPEPGDYVDPRGKGKKG